MLYSRLARCAVSASLLAGSVVAISIAAAPAATATTAASVPGSFQDLRPARFLDTRTGLGAARAAVRGGHSVGIQIGGRGLVPASGVSAVALTVTAMTATGSGYLTVFGHGTPRPDTSDVHYAPGLPESNLVIARVGTGGMVDVYVGGTGTVQLAADVSGYYLSGTPSLPGTFTPLAPQRFLSTREGIGAPMAAVAAGHTLAVQIAGRGNVPATGVAAVAIELTATGPTRTGGGDVTIYAHGTARPATSDLHYTHDHAAQNLVVAKLSADGRVDLGVVGTGSAQLIGDVSGYFLSGAANRAGTFVALTPQRFLNTHIGAGAPRAAVAAGHVLSLQITGRGQVPVGNVGVVALSVTAFSPTATGGITAFRHGVTRPATTDLQFVRGQTVTNLVFAELSADGKVDLRVAGSGTVQLAADVSGYYLSAPTPASVTASKSEPIPGAGLSVTAGQPAPITYQVSVGNSGGTDSTAVTVTDTVPAGTTYVPGSASCNATPNCSPTAAAGVITWSLTSVGAGDTRDLTFQASVDAADTNGTTVSNSASFTNVNTPGCATPTCPTNTVTNPVITRASVTVTKSQTPPAGTVTAGQLAPVTYQLTVANSGGTGSDAVTVTDTVPADTTYVSGSTSCGTTPNCTVAFAAGTVTWSLSSAAPTSSSDLSFQVTVDAAAANGATLSNSASFTNINTPGCATPTCPTNTVTNPVITPASIAVVKSATPAAGTTVTAGQVAPISYQLAVTNSGGTATTTVIVTDAIPVGTTYVPGSASCGTTPTCSVTDVGTLRWTLTSVAPLSTENLTFQVTVDAADADASTVTNTAFFTNINTPACVTPTCPTNAVTHPVTTQPGITVVKSANPASGSTVTAGQAAPITYQLAVTNSGGTASGPVTVTDTVPAGTTYVAASATCGAAPDCTSAVAGGVVTWTFSTVDGPSTANVSFDVSIDAADANGSVISNDATFTNVNTAGCATPTCPTNTVTHHVITPASIDVAKSETPPAGIVTAGQGAPITYQLAVQNSGGTASSAVTVTDTVPAGTSYFSGSATCGTAPTCTVSVGGGIVTWTLPVAALTTENLSFQVTVDASDANGSTIANNADFTNLNTPGCATPTCPTNTVTNSVITMASISVDKSASPVSGSTVTAGQAAPITYELAVHNIGGTPSDPMTVTDPIPAGTTYLPDSATCGTTPACTVADTGTIIWTIGSIAPTSTVNLTFQVTVNAADANGSTIANTASFNNINTPACITPTCDTNTVSHPVVTRASVTVVKSEPTPGAGVTVTAGQPAPISYQLDATNPGGTAAGPITVTDPIPAGTTYVAGSVACPVTPECTGTATASDVTWTFTSVAALTTYVLTFEVTVDAADLSGSTIDNAATFTNVNTPGCSTPSCVTNTVSNPVITPASVTVVKSEPSPGAGSTVVPGQSAPLTYRFAVHNSGATDSGSFTLSDTVPTGSSYVLGSATCPAALNAGTTPSCTVNVGPTIVWIFSSIPALTSYGAFGFNVAVDAAAVSGSTITNTATFTNAGTPGCVTATCNTNAISNPVDAPPVAVNDAATVGEDSGATAIPVLTNDTDVDGGLKTVASVTQPANGTVVITGGGVTYAPNNNYCNSPPGTTPDTFTYTLNGGSTATVSITVTCVDDPPVAVNDAATVSEDSGATAVDVLANDTDVDGGPKSIGSVSQPANGTVVISGGGTGLTYQPGANYCNNPPGTTLDTFSYVLNGGSTATVSITVNCTPDAPMVTTSSGITVYTEHDPATFIDSAVTVTDTDAGGMIASATVQVTGNFTSGQDVLALSNPLAHPLITASFAGSTLSLTGAATPAQYQSALRDVTYVNSSDAPSALTRTVTFTVTDDTALTGSGTRAIQVVPVDDNPVAVNDSATVLEDSGATAIAVLSNDTDVDGGPKAIGSVTQPANGAVVITGGGTGLTYQPNPNYCNNPPGTTPDWFTYTLTPGGSVATVSMTVTCVNDPPTAGDDTFNAPSSAVGNTALVVNSSADGPQSVTGPKKSLNANILANDTDGDGPNAVTVVAGTFASNDGGTVVIESDGDFTFMPAAGTSCVDTSDFFDYTVTDGNTPTPGTDTGRVTIAITGCVWYVNNNAAGNTGTSTAPFDTLAQAQTASAAGDTIFLEDGDNTTGGYNAGFDLKTNQRLLGEAATLQIGADVLQAAIPANRPTITDNNADVVKLASGNIVRGVQLDPQGTGGGIAGGDGTAPGSIAGGTIDDVQIIDTGTAGTQPGLDLDTTSGTFNISDLTVTNGGSATAIGVRLNNAGTVNFSATGTISITTAGAKGLDATGTNLGSGSVFDDITVTGSGSGAVSMVSTTGTTSLGDGTGGDLALTTTSGANPALNIVNAGPTTVPTAGTSNVHATGGPAVNVTGTTGSTLTLDVVSSTNSASQGINLVGLDTSTFSAASGTLAGFAGTAFVVNGGSGDIIYLGSVNDGPGNTADITNRTAGQVILSGTINDSNDAGGGISLTGNTGGVVSMNGNKTLSTGASDAFTAAFPDGSTATVLLTGGGIHITTTSGKGLTATGVGPTPDGSVLVTSSGASTIDSSSGTALNVTNVAISPGDMTFQRISAGNNTAAADPADGIVLNNTGVNARLVIASSGFGTCTTAVTSGCTGGEIQHAVGGDDSTTTPTGTGVVLNNTLNPSFTRMWIHDASNYGIRGTSVAGFTLADSVINGTNGDNGTTPFDDSSVWFDNLTGSAAVTNSVVSGGFEDNFRIVNTSGSLNRITFTSDTIGDNSAAGGNDGILLESATTAGQLMATIQSSTFTGAGGDLLQYDHNGSGTGDLVLTANAFSNNHPGIATGGGGLTLTNGGTSGATTMSITGGNTFRDAVGNGLTIAKSTGTSTQTGTFSGNTIGVNAVANSGSAEGDALKIQSLGQGSLNWTVTNNTIRGYNNFGVEFEGGGGATAQSGAINATITGNTIDQPGNTAGTLSLPKNGVHLNIGTVPGDTYQACAVIGGAGALANTLASAGADAVPPAGGGQDVRLRQRQSTTIRLPGYAGAPTDTTAVQAFVAANNPSGGPAVIASVNSPPGGGFTGTGSTCP